MTKKETYAQKLARLLGLEEVKESVEKEKAARKGNTQGISEDEIQSFRQAQGIIYYLQAPALFQHKVCKHCGADFLVSRLYVAYCSYTCINKSMEEAYGVSWKHKDDIETAINQVYEGNEPLWIKNLPQLRSALEKLVNSTTESPSPSTSTHLEDAST